VGKIAAIDASIAARKRGAVTRALTPSAHALTVATEAVRPAVSGLVVRRTGQRKEDEGAGFSVGLPFRGERSARLLLIRVGAV